MTWDKYFMDLAFVAATKSKDLSTKVGAVVVGKSNQVLSIGYNGIPRGANDDLPERQERPLKYSYFEHAERNAVYNAARHGVALEGSRIYVTGCPCMDCTRAIIQSGITEVIFTYKGFSEEAQKRWKEQSVLSIDFFKECGVLCREVVNDF